MGGTTCVLAVCIALLSVADAFVPGSSGCPRLLRRIPANPSKVGGRAGSGALQVLRAAEKGLGIGDLAILGALKKLRGGDVTHTRAVHYPGSINECYKFSCETASFFVKINRSFSAQDMFEGEAGSLQAMKYAGMAVPHPLKVGDLPHGGSYFIMTHVPFEQDLMLQPQCQARLGEALSKMHLHQPERHQFYGFGHPTRLGTTEMENKFRATWSEFFVESRLRPALELVQAKKIPARYLIEHADEICASAKKILQELDGNIRPSILHGDLWLGNTGATGEGNIVVYDPSSFYGHAEFDLAFRGWPAQNGFPGLGDEFWTSYHWHMPREPGFEERQDLYQLFHLLNHACMFGQEYMLMAEEAAKRVIKL